MLTLRLVFHLALRQTEGVARSVLALLGLGLAMPDHTTLSRRGRAFAGRQARVRAGTGPVHLVLDSTGLELFGQGECCAAKHGRLRRRWPKLHIGVDATTGEITAHVLTDGDGDDAVHAPDLLRQCEGTLASVTADGAYDRCQGAARLYSGLSSAAFALIAAAMLADCRSTERQVLVAWSVGLLTSIEARAALSVRSQGELLDRAFAAHVSVPLPHIWDRGSRSALAAAFARARL